MARKSPAFYTNGPVFGRIGYQFRGNLINCYCWNIGNEFQRSSRRFGNLGRTVSGLWQLLVSVIFARMSGDIKLKDDLMPQALFHGARCPTWLCVGKPLFQLSRVIYFVSKLWSPYLVILVKLMHIFHTSLPSTNFPHTPMWIYQLFRWYNAKFFSPGNNLKFIAIT